MQEKSSQDRTIDLTGQGGLKFVESTHSYFNPKGERYSGITTLLKRYEHEFDTGLGSLNSAIKEVIINNFGDEKFNELKMACKQVGLQKNTNPNERKFIYGHTYLHTKFDSITKKYPNLKEEIISTKARLLKEWKATSDEAIRIGSLEHDRREQQIKDEGYWYEGIHYKYISDRNILNVRIDENVVIPECLVWNHERKLGGLADIFLFKQGVVSVQDYKTNELIEKKSFNNRMMKGVCSSLMDSNFFHYSLQLKLYQKMAILLRPDLKIGENLIINTKSEKYNRPEDILLNCHNVDMEVELIFRELCK